MEQKNTLNISTKLTEPTTILKHSPINITKNAELATMAITGDGSNTNPYIIENFLINSCKKNESGINVQNTNKYFVLRNINVSNCTAGFSFTNVTFSNYHH